MGAYGKYLKGSEPCDWCIRGWHRMCKKGSCTCQCPKIDKEIKIEKR